MVDINVIPVGRGHIKTDLNHLIEGHTMGSAEEPSPEVTMTDGPVYNLVIDHPEATILWDTGSHPQAGTGHWPAELYAAFEHYDAHEHPLDDDLEQAGYSVDEIDCVLQTHLHLDHAGGLEHFAGTDTPIFVHEKELKFAYYSAKSSAGSDAYVLGDFDHDLNWEVLHRKRETHFEDVEFVHLPGHTPGVVGTLLHTDEESLLFTGDECYTRANYTEEVPLGAGLLWSHRHWYDSLRHAKELERRHDAAVFCGHDPNDFEQLRERNA
jgi:N-acyl homoserine lactone hydrolase